MRILSLDPGLERIGFAVLQKEGSRLAALDYGLIETPRIDLPSRLLLIHERLTEIIQTHRPDVAAIEKLLFAVNKTTAMDVAKASGVLILTCRQAGLDVHEITPPEVKQAVVGNGAADKKQVQFMVTKLLALRETPKPDDVADALAIGIAHAFRAPVSSAIGKMGQIGLK
ncbi:MAG TPA: crossover junction endodeoxyribonuclease RuvC [Fimbriimonadaceae bacterium]|nr:crossover junction endodeoxyribonuclease RuvC [Fimbriimonadaceae bacterium]